VALSVSNEGTPIPAKEQARIFQPLQRGPQGADGSLGLGLYIVQQIARAHGGSVVVRSSEGEGTTFTLRLSRA
jgi:signal transduction histidine kinase